MERRSPHLSASGRPTRWLTRIGDWIAPENNPSAVIYGVLAGGALLAAESTRKETLAEALGASAMTLVLYWLAHAYAHALGDRLESRHPWTAGQLLRIAGHEAALLKGAALPVVVLAVAAVTGSSPPDAVLAALITTGVLLVAIELIAGRRAQLRGLELAIQVVVAGGLGVGVVVLKLVIH